LEKGYSIAREGLTVIAEIKNGEFNLHLWMKQQPQSLLPGSAWSDIIKDINQGILHTSRVHRFYLLLLVENRTPTQIILTNRRIPDRNVRWCERTGSQTMATFLLDCKSYIH
jgi:hypothetical protein